MKAAESSLIDGTYKKISQELTAQKAIKVLQLQGVLEAKPGDGLYVVGKPKTLEESAVDLLSKKNNPIVKSYKKKGNRSSIGVVMPFWISTRGSAYAVMCCALVA